MNEDIVLAGVMT